MAAPAGSCGTDVKVPLDALWKYSTGNQYTELSSKIWQVEQPDAVSCAYVTLGLKLLAPYTTWAWLLVLAPGATTASTRPIVRILPHDSRSTPDTGAAAASSARSSSTKPFSCMTRRAGGVRRSW